MYVGCVSDVGMVQVECVGGVCVCRCEIGVRCVGWIWMSMGV